MVDKSRVLKTDVVIIGAGPSGCSASLYLSKLGGDHVLVEKDSFPRDKVCGDALSGKVVSQLKALYPKWIDEIKALDILLQLFNDCHRASTVSRMTTLTRLDRSLVIILLRVSSFNST